MNLSKDPPSNEFHEVLKQWVSRSITKTHKFLEFDSLKDIVDEFSRNVDVLSSKFGRIFVIFLTMNSLSEDPNIYSQIDWKSVLSNLLSMKGAFTVIVCICNQKSFNNLVVTFQEEGFMDDISMEYGFYQASKQEVPLSRSSGSWMNLPLLVYVYLFPSQEGKFA
jgi:hypothetical protein